MNGRLHRIEAVSVSVSRDLDVGNIAHKRQPESLSDNCRMRAVCHPRRAALAGDGGRVIKRTLSGRVFGAFPRRGACE